MYDWKAPLYESAISAMRDMDLSSFMQTAQYFRLLGDYRNSHQMLEDCLNFPDTYYSRILCRIEIAETGSNLDGNIAEMHKLYDLIGEEVFKQTLWQDRNTAFEKAVKKARRRIFLKENRKFLTNAAVIAVFSIVVISFGVYSHIRPDLLIKRAEQSFKKGSYAEAVSLYENAIKESGSYIEQSETANRVKDRLNEARIMAGRDYMEAGDYYSALRYFKDAGDDALIEEASLAYAGVLKESGNYSDAAEYYINAGKSKEADDARIELASVLRDKGEYDSAIDTLRSVSDQSIAEDTLHDLYMERAEEQVRKFHELKEKDEESVSKLCSVIDDVDGQLYFAGEIVDAGLKPYDVYPAGAEVRNLSLDYDLSKATVDAAPDMSRIIAVFRIKSPPRSTPGDMITYTKPYYRDVISGSEGKEHTVIKVFPSLMYSIDPRYRAGTLADCTAYLLINSYYEEADTVNGVWHHRDRNTLKSEDYPNSFITYDRHDEIYICDKKNPGKIRKIADKVNHARALIDSEKSPDSTVFEYTDAELIQTADALIGQPDNDWVSSTLAETISYINQQEE
ncbi:MAG: hypothetical protein IJ123_07200 [Blautia sp.]|nr:hypothetical protein [Blautia sp.]